MYLVQSTTLVLEEWRKPEYPEKNLSEERREPTKTQNTCVFILLRTVPTIKEVFLRGL